MAGLAHLYEPADATEENRLVKAVKAYTDGTEIDRNKPTRRLSTTCMVAEMASQSSAIQKLIGAINPDTEVLSSASKM